MKQPGALPDTPDKSPYKALEKFSKALYGTMGGTYSARVLRPLMSLLPVLAQARRYPEEHSLHVATTKLPSH